MKRKSFKRKKNLNRKETSIKFKWITFHLTCVKFVSNNFLQVSHGSIIRAHTLELKKKLNESDAELLALAITELRQRFALQSKEIYVPFKVDLGDDIKVTVPKLGDKKRIVEREGVASR